ncbi:MAG: sulfur carrier protein ThiS [Alphaproteobacteria bacterium]|nr:sulfur carrier protein ThiS [Alphaproteobacteria bacterium]
MKLRINGQEHVMTDQTTVRGVLNQLGFGEKPVVVELNQHALFPREHETTMLHEGDTMEIVQITAGG